MYDTGEVAIVQPDSTVAAFAVDSGNLFRVRWQDGVFPRVASNCANGACTVSGETCLCHTQVQTTAVFISSDHIPTRQEVEARLTIGSPGPDAFDDGEYTLCTSAACEAASRRPAGASVTVYTLSASGGAFDERTIFRILANSTRLLHLVNKASLVVLPLPRPSADATVGAFRNPPRFLSFLRPSTRDAEAETEALLDHLFFHPNTAPFIAQRLIQRLVSSNPSPRYVQTVARAFMSGQYNTHTYSGEYGDLAATIAAILLDSEARSVTLDSDPTHGQLREPILKVLHLMRSMEYESSGGREVELKDLENKIGMAPYTSPTVFNFYSPEYAPDGPVAVAELVSPEAELAISPYLIGMLDGMSSLVRLGLTNCAAGFGSALQGSRCNSLTNQRLLADGQLAFSPQSWDSASVVTELNMLLTGGRLSSVSQGVIQAAYDATMMQSASEMEALRSAQELFLSTAEFHVTNMNAMRATPHVLRQSQSTASLGRPYKAIVYLFLNGGLDSFNVVVPHSNCGVSGDLYARYASVRGNVALEKAKLLTIDASSSVQPCSVFGLHPALPFLKSLYEDGDASIIANVGPLVEPTSKSAVLGKSARLPPSLFAHNVQRTVAQNVHADQATSAKGVIGRLLAALSSPQPSGNPPYKTKAYSVAGNTKAIEGTLNPPEMLSWQHGVVRFQRYSETSENVAKLTANESASIYGETFSALLKRALAESEELGGILESSSVGVDFGSDFLSGQLKQVARVIGARQALSAERDAFFVKLGGFDTHSNANTVLNAKLTQINAALQSFVTELKRQGIWDSVTIQLASEFGRTMTSNGRGTDHGVAGSS